MSLNKTALGKLKTLKRYAISSFEEMRMHCLLNEEGKNNTQDIDLFWTQHPFLEELYIVTLKDFGGSTIAWLDLLPLDSNEVPDIHSSLEDLREYWDHSAGYLPFAEDGGALIYCFNDKAEVWTFSLEGYGDPPIYLAASFEEFINDCLLGKRYKEFFDAPEDSFYDFLKAQGWV